MSSSDFPTAWYAIASECELKRKSPLGIKRFGRDLVLWRNAEGEVTTMEDRCPHRSVKLSLGTLKNGNCLECPFHGMMFDAKGRCQLIPETKKAAPALTVKTYPTRQKNGFIWIWYSVDGALPVGEPQWFDEIPKNAVSKLMTEVVGCHITRAIENQLDYAHLGVVHRSTIGRGFDPSREPRFDLSHSDLRFFFTDAKTQVESMIALKFPNVWLNKIIDRYMISLVFAPVDESHTKLYLTSHQTFVTNPFFGALFNWFMNFFNRYVLREDSRIVATHPNGVSVITGEREVLLHSDKVIRHFRQVWSKKISQ